MELEKDLSLQRQLLDVVIIEKKGGKTPDPLPDGLENLAAHNLMTYKSHQESLDGWTIEELCGHYVNYRKRLGPSSEKLPLEEDFQLYAVRPGIPKNWRVKLNGFPAPWAFMMFGGESGRFCLRIARGVLFSESAE